MKLRKDELIDIVGGSTTSYTSATFISAITRGLNVLMDIGRSVGTAISRLINKNVC